MLPATGFVVPAEAGTHCRAVTAVLPVDSSAVS